MQAWNADPPQVVQVVRDQAVPLPEHLWSGVSGMRVTQPVEVCAIPKEERLPPQRGGVLGMSVPGGDHS